MRVNMLLMKLEQSQQKALLHHRESTQMARECCQSVTYMATSSFLGSFFILLALRTCLLVLEDEAQQKWVTKRLTELGESKLPIAKDFSRESDTTDVLPGVEHEQRPNHI